ncbi:MAG TPA: hypothetical protein VGB03_09285 [Acidimicrobiales bacterium]|jgi:hypothetical protein
MTALVVVAALVAGVIAVGCARRAAAPPLPRWVAGTTARCSSDVRLPLDLDAVVRA